MSDYLKAISLADKIISAKEDWQKGSLMNTLINTVWKKLTDKEQNDIITYIENGGY